MSRFSERRLLIRIAVSLALVAILLWRIDLTQAGRALRDANYFYIIPALVLFALAKLLVAQRWRLMMSEFADVPLPPLFGILLVSNLANNVMPARIGDVIRVQIPAQRYDVSRARLAATVFATESLLDGIVFATLGLIGLGLINLKGFPTGVFWGVLGLVAGGLIAVIPLSHLKLQDGWTQRGIIPRLPDRIRLALEEAVPHFVDGLAVFRNLKLGAQAIALSFTLWFIEIAMFVLIGEAFGIRLSLPAWMLVMVTANMISSVPIAPSNIGPYEVAVTELLKALGVEAGVAGGFAITAHIFTILWITGAGALSMWLLGLGIGDVFSLGRKPADPTAAAPPPVAVDGS
ncbi:MAG TPA: lysylphosphatidylglycerol synthase transmembrane domain-containing protein [Dehalococcoidia bacterium]|nr:lysylphosphatidylglycerol synthase transmembrane domain-containing protein [Dehalococcoidia bacterium]